MKIKQKTITKPNKKQFDAEVNKFLTGLLFSKVDSHIFQSVLRRSDHVNVVEGKLVYTAIIEYYEIGLGKSKADLQEEIDDIINNQGHA